MLLISIARLILVYVRHHYFASALIIRFNNTNILEHSAFYGYGKSLLMTLFIRNGRKRATKVSSLATLYYAFPNMFFLCCTRI